MAKMGEFTFADFRKSNVACLNAPRLRSRGGNGGMSRPPATAVAGRCDDVIFLKFNSQ
jgi:hypothetical protein